MELIEEGHVSPSAELVAERAGVGLRSVFRHFKDMDGLYRQMSVLLTTRLEQLARQPFRAMDWRGRVLEMVDRRAAAYERLAPFLAAGQALRHRSKVLREGHDRFVALLRAILVEQLPAEIVQDHHRLESIDLMLSAEVWQRLRNEQGLDALEAKALIAQVLRQLLER